MILGGDDRAPIEKVKQANWEHLVVLDQIEPNKMKAYNTALAQPGLGDILIFSDLDCEFPVHFLEQYNNAFADPKKNIITGRVCPDPKANHFIDRYHRHFEAKIAPASPVRTKSIVGSNFAVRKSFFLNAYRRFDESVAIGTDHAIAARFNELGETIYFEPGIKVHTPFFSEGLWPYMQQQSRWVRIRVLGNKDANQKVFRKSLRALLLPWFMAVLIPLSLMVIKLFSAGTFDLLWWALFLFWVVLLAVALSKRYAIFRRGKKNRINDLIAAGAMLGIHYGIQMLAGFQLISNKHKYRW